MSGRLLLFGLLVATSAVAQVRRIAVVCVPRTDDAEKTALEHQRTLSEALRTDERFEFVEVLARSGEEAGTQQRHDAEASLAAVDELIASVDYPGARTRAQKALAELSAADFRQVGPAYVRLLLQLSQVKFALGADDRGTAELMLAFSLEPQVQPLRGMNREEKRRFEDQQLVVATRPRAAAVTFLADHPGWLWVDGHYRGVTPLTVSDLSAARHFFTFVAPGGEPAVSSELLGTVATVQLSSKLEGRGKALRALLASLRGANVDAAARELRRWSEVDELLVVSFGGTTAPQVLRATTTQVIKKLATSPADTHLLTIARELLEDSNVAQLSLAPAPAPPVARSRVPGVIVISVGVAAAAAGAILLGVAQGQAEAAQRIPQIESTVAGAGPYHEQIAAANGTQAGGAIALGAGLVAIGIGIAVVW